MLNGYYNMGMLAPLILSVFLVRKFSKIEGGSEYRNSKYIIHSCAISSCVLTLALISMLMMDNPSNDISELPKNVNQLVAYADGFFSQLWQVAFILINIIANITFATCLLSICALYFQSLTRLTYRRCVILMSIESIAVATSEFTMLMEIAFLLLLIIYPAIITLLTIYMLNVYVNHSKTTIKITTLNALLFGFFDGLATQAVS
ncbi:branched-chain amino acid transport system II carrier protein, partial [Aeromonas finlandensis]|uniref:branched-chain amino acid transport system II carrier protein n=1 Tax=Aeromonas finlandensis TaxID=1543375 RepID=UPI002409563B